MFVMLGATGGFRARRWVAYDGVAWRMQAYVLRLSCGVSIGFLGFASYANRAPVCEALSPIWLSILSLSAAGMVLLSLLPLRSWRGRLIAGGGVAAGRGGACWLDWPPCLADRKSGG